MSRYEIIVSQASWEQKLEVYRKEVFTKRSAGKYLQDRLSATGLAELNSIDFLQLLLNTKRPQIFAESAIAGDGSDWNQMELSILGDVSIATPVMIFDNGRHQNPEVHANPFSGTLLFTPGALLRNGRGVDPCDLADVTRGGELDPVGYFNLYERRLLPPLLYANKVCQQTGKKGFITIPGMGCGAFAGRFQGQLNELLNQTLKAILQKHVGKMGHIRAVYYDPYSKCENERYEIDGLSYLVRPLLNGNEHKSQLCYPAIFEEAGDDFSGCEFFSFVAWDHVSWPGNDFYIGSRATDDGVKAAATDVTRVMTGVAGEYSANQFKYEPPTSYRNWDHVIRRHNLEISANAQNVQLF
ncbi:MAG: hypothetical protein AB8G95_27280 [Anaerolineae bacterium]